MQQTENVSMGNLLLLRIGQLRSYKKTHKIRLPGNRETSHGNVKAKSLTVTACWRTYCTAQRELVQHASVIMLLHTSFHSKPSPREVKSCIPQNDHPPHNQHHPNNTHTLFLTTDQAVNTFSLQTGRHTKADITVCNSY